eukprot:5030855-Prymnesium_polylepis.1
MKLDAALSGARARSTSPTAVVSDQRGAEGRGLPDAVEERLALALRVPRRVARVDPAAVVVHLRHSLAHLHAQKSLGSLTVGRAVRPFPARGRAAAQSDPLQSHARGSGARARAPRACATAASAASRAPRAAP